MHVGERRHRVLCVPSFDSIDLLKLTLLLSRAAGKVFDLYDSSHTCRKTPDVNEVVLGTLPKLPGCNPVTGAGPNATPCTDPNPPAIFSNPVAYTGAAPYVLLSHRSSSGRRADDPPLVALAGPSAPRSRAARRPSSPRTRRPRARSSPTRTATRTSSTVARCPTASRPRPRPSRRASKRATPRTTPTAVRRLPRSSHTSQKHELTLSALLQVSSTMEVRLVLAKRPLEEA